MTEFSTSADSLRKRGTGDQIRIITALRAQRGYIHILVAEILQSYIAPVRWSKSIVEVGDRKRTAAFSKSSLRRSGLKWNKSPAHELLALSARSSHIYLSWVYYHHPCHGIMANIIPSNIV